MLLSDDCFMKSTCQKKLRGGCTENSFCIKLFKLERLFSNSLLPSSKWGQFSLRIDKDGTDKEQFTQLSKISRDIEEFVKSGKNLYIYSSICGNGKTSWAIRIIQSYFDRIWYAASVDEDCSHALFINIPNFFIQLKNSISNKSEYIDFIKKNVYSADLVVWDDVGTKIGTEFEMENFLSILDTRLSTNKSNIYTSNILPHDLKDRVGERLYSRIINGSIGIQFNGSDKRGICN